MVNNLKLSVSRIRRIILLYKYKCIKYVNIWFYIELEKQDLYSTKCHYTILLKKKPSFVSHRLLWIQNHSNRVIFFDRR